MFEYCLLGIHVGVVIVTNIMWMCILCDHISVSVRWETKTYLAAKYSSTR